MEDFKARGGVNRTEVHLEAARRDLRTLERELERVKAKYPLPSRSRDIQEYIEKLHEKMKPLKRMVEGTEKVLGQSKDSH